MDATREARAAVLRAKLYRWFTLGVFAVVGFVIVTAYNLPPSPKEMAGRALLEVKRQQDRAVEIQRAKGGG
jgi:hypothetical protein